MVTGLAASIDMVGVTLGGILGHSICTGVAVLGGRQMAAHIREKTVAVRSTPLHLSCLQLNLRCQFGILCTLAAS